MAVDLFGGDLAHALEARLRPLLPWWFQLQIRLDDERGEVSYRVSRFGLRSGWGKESWSRATDVLVAIQSAVWNAKHREWPARNGKLGSPCTHASLPEPEVVVREHKIYTSFPTVGVAPPPIDLSRRLGR